MVYLIDNRLMFRTEDGALWPSGDERSAVILTLTMSRLLVCLLERRGEAITRNELLDSVWDAHGLRSSSHTLNKYISSLRKYFVQLGIAGECITTLPRVGFMFNSDIEVRVMTEPHPSGESPADHHERQDRKVKRRIGPQSGTRLLFYMFALVTILTSAGLVRSGLAIKSELPRKLQALTPHFLFNYGSCPVYTVQSNSVALAEQKKILFTALAESDHIACLEGASFLYQVSESYLYDRKGRVFISRCTQDNNRYISCLNNYWSGYERHK